MKRAMFAGLALALSATGAYAADQFAGMYGNTLHIKDSDGRESAVLVNADHTWSQSGADGKGAHGTYEWTDDTHFCIVVLEPAPKPGEQPGKECHEMSGDHKVGDSWTMTDEHGTAQMSITAGR